MLWSTKCDSSVAFLSFTDHTAAYGKPKCSAFPSSDWIFRNGEQLIASTVVLPIPMLLPLWISFWRSYRRLIYPTEFILTAALRKYGFSGINTLLMQLTEICTTYFMFVIQRRPKNQPKYQYNWQRTEHATIPCTARFRPAAISWKAGAASGHGCTGYYVVQVWPCRTVVSKLF